MRQALKRVSTIMSMVLPLISVASAATPRSGCTISTAMEKNPKIIPDTTLPARSVVDAALAESSMIPRKICKVRKTAIKVFARSPWRNSLTNIGEMRSEKSVRWVRVMEES